MSRYIDAELLEKKVLEPSMFDINKDDVLALIAEISAADVVEVVRCKDCKHRNPNGYKCLRDNLWHKDKDYCSYGERRSENDG